MGIDWIKIKLAKVEANLSVSLDKLIERETDIMRAYVITQNNLFPLEWRQAVSRSLTCAEVQNWLVQWRTFLQEVKAGKHLAYHVRVFLHEHQLDLHTCYEKLKWAWEKSQTLENAWAKKTDFLMMHAKLGANFLPTLTLSDYPIFLSENAEEDATPHIAQWKEHQQIAQYAQTQIKEWNKRASQSYKVSFPQSIDFQIPNKILQMAQDKQLQGFLLWCEDAVARGLDLYWWE
jgi:hypothetical protein